MNRRFWVSAFFLLTIPLIAKVCEQDFIKRYEIDEALKSILDTHSEDIERKLNSFSKKTFHHGFKKHGVWQFSWLPGYFVKYNLDRLFGMEKMRACIEKYHLNLITVPDKRLYHLKNKAYSLNSDNYLVIIKKIEQAPYLPPLTLEQVRQLCTLMKHTGYVSMTKSNYIRGENGLMTIIDTESTFDHKRPFLGLRRLLSAGHSVEDYTEEAIKYLLKEIARCIQEHMPYTGYQEILGYLRNSPKAVEWDLIDYFDHQLSTKKIHI